MATLIVRPRRPFPWTVFLVAVGLLLRLLHYLRDPALWHDEAALIVNVLGKNFRELLGPLFFFEAAPPLFLWLERACVLLLDDGTYSLRLLPFLASCGSLLLLTWLARQVLRPDAVPWVVLLAAFSDRLLWHTCEAKPYAVDVFMATALPALFWATRSWALPRRLLTFAAVAPLTIFLVYPGCFLLGGALIAFLPGVLRYRTLRSFLSYGLLLMAVGTFFLLLALGPAHAQRCGPMESCWLHAFPHWDRPWLLPWWSLKATVEVVDFCFRPLGGCLAPLAVYGGVLFYRKGRLDLLLLLVVPLGLGWLAGLFHAYPYTGARVMVYTLPALALFIGEGAATLLQWLRSNLPALSTFTIPRFAPPVLSAVVVALLLAPAGLSVYRAILPWNRTDWPGATDFVLKNLGPNDLITSNAWEMSYYYRHLGSVYRYMDAGLPEGGTRLWVLVMADTEAERRAVVERKLSREQRILDQASFEGASVYCVGRTEAVALDE
jgi:hypothetical protein